MNNDISAKDMVGRIVYPPYTPSQLRKVLTCSDRGLFFGDVIDTKGVVHKNEPLYAYGDYQQLIDDHQRKADNHKKKLEDALAKFDEIEKNK